MTPKAATKRFSLKIKTMSNFKRITNILTKADSLGYELDITSSLEDVILDAENYIIENTLEKYFKKEFLAISRGRNQYFEWSDGEGYSISSSGEICDYSRKRFVIENERKLVQFPYQLLVDSNADVVELYEEREADEFESQHYF